MIRVILAVGGSLFLMSVSPVLAHHSYSQFHDHVVSVSGTLEKVVFANPHTMLTVRGDAGTVYTGNWRSAFQLHRMGVNSTDLKVGDVVVISGTPSRDAASHEMARLSEVRRMSDGWTWRLEVPAGQANVITRAVPR